ncbi:PrpF domain-containing protein [Brevibacterium spongiae]|uniref:4-oxalomesaconate tautomerase n=1 Tax=Brevibacterium spongiae TaxID=2909672 RepID=A0ABY5SPK1_9MICO|nr:PrpF domain-containing protein [Brevibacterium spongiae]UVI36235.1 4-oxalomesaconate tautomerase [Brevibacterium spongiae]
MTARHSQLRIQGMLMRGGSSRGPFFRAEDLPSDPAERNRVLINVLGSPHPLQVDGIGGGHPLTSKAGIVSVSDEEGIDLDFIFAQMTPDSDSVQTTANCGNMLAAVVPFAIESGLLTANDDWTTAVVKSLNTGLISRITVRTPEASPGGERYVAYAGDVRIAGVPGTGSGIEIRFVDTAGSVADSMMPSGNLIDEITLDSGQVVETTLIDNGQPLVLIRATDLGRTGYEAVADLSADEELKNQLEDIRLKAGRLMGLGDVTGRSYPKMTLVAAPAGGGTICTRSFIPHRVHESIGVLAALTVATAARLTGTVAATVSPADGADATAVDDGGTQILTIEHPSGGFDVALECDSAGQTTGAGITRTARLLMSGEFHLHSQTDL